MTDNTELIQRGNELARDLEYAHFPQSAEIVRNLVDRLDEVQNRNQQALDAITAELNLMPKRPLTDYERALRDRLAQVTAILKGGSQP